MSNSTTQKRWVITSTWGQHHIAAEDEQSAEELAETFLENQGYTDPSNMILDGLTEPYDYDAHGDWDGDS